MKTRFLFFVTVIFFCLSLFVSCVGKKRDLNELSQQFIESIARNNKSQYLDCFLSAEKVKELMEKDGKVSEEIMERMQERDRDINLFLENAIKQLKERGVVIEKMRFVTVDIDVKALGKLEKTEDISKTPAMIDRFNITATEGDFNIILFKMGTFKMDAFKKDTKIEGPRFLFFYPVETIDDKLYFTNQPNPTIEFFKGGGTN
jgi:hypothetical protein